MGLSDRLEKLEKAAGVGEAPRLYFLHTVRDGEGVVAAQIGDNLLERLPGESITDLKKRARATVEPNAMVVSWVRPGEVRRSETS